MRYVNVLVAAGVVVVGFTGSLTAAHALSLPEAAPMPQPIPGLPLDLLGPDDTAPATKLTVTYRADDKSAPVVMQLSCEPTGGDHPRAADACTSLATAEQSDSDPFAKPAKDEMCTFIYGGPQTATVVGTWNGAGVDAKFSRANGCEISRWDAIEPVLAPAAAAKKWGTPELRRASRTRFVGGWTGTHAEAGLASRARGSNSGDRGNTAAWVYGACAALPRPGPDRARCRP